MNDPNLEWRDTIYQIQDMIRQIEQLNQNCNDNMKNLNQMMLELKGLVAMVRPQVKKTGWYGEEIDHTKRSNDATMEIELK